MFRPMVRLLTLEIEDGFHILDAIHFQAHPFVSSLS